MSVDPQSHADFAHDDAAYVLGALSPARRQAFEAHLATCADCTRSVRELAGMPGLLARVDESVFLGSDEVPPVPDTLLPQLLRSVRRQRRRTRWLAVGGVAAAMVAAVLFTAFQLDGSDPTRPVQQAMAQVDQQALTASVSLQQVGWGTKMHLTCTYEHEYGATPDSYALVVRTVDGDREQVATWRAVPGRTLEIDAATAAYRDQIRTVDVVDVDTGRSVLTLDASS